MPKERGQNSVPHQPTAGMKEGTAKTQKRKLSDSNTKEPPTKFTFAKTPRLPPTAFPTAIPDAEKPE